MGSNEWAHYWRCAKKNMPSHHPDFPGSSRPLRMLLGYKVFTDAGKKVSCGQHVTSAIQRGDRPRDPEKQQLLKLLAGPHGSTIAKAIAAKRGIDLSKWPYWPNDRRGK